MNSPREAARLVAEVLLSGPFEDGLLQARAAALAGRRRWLRGCVQRMITAWGRTSRPSPRWVVAFLLGDERFRKRWPTLRFDRAANIVRAMAPSPDSPMPWPVPALTTPSELASWCEVPLDELVAHADGLGREASTPAGPMRNYRYHWRGKRSGAARLIEAPKPRLKNLQRRVLRGILDAIPPHEAAHGFRRGSSVRSFAAPHVGRAAVLRMDLEDFFASVRGARVEAIFYAAGYPASVARLLAGLCWNVAPDDVWLDYPGTLPHDLVRWSAARRYASPHLPQGAPTSPALANLGAFGLDRRLSRLAHACGAVYTRYADDLLFSGDERFARVAAGFVRRVVAIAHEEGFTVHLRKTRLMRPGVRQFAAGVVLNERLNVPRRDYEQLKAVLHRARLAGPTPPTGLTVEEFRRQLRGKIAWVSSLNPARGAKLLATFEKIDWGAST